MKVLINNWINMEEIESLFNELINNLPTEVPGEGDENELRF